MKLHLGVPEVGPQGALAKRLARFTLLRLVFLSVLLGIIGRWYLREVQLRAFSVQLALLALACAFALAGVYAAILRTGRRLRTLAYAQLLFDQMTWTVLVYLSGGATSGATSLYGLSALTGAILLGLPAATVSAVAGYLNYLLLCVLMVTGVLAPPPDQADRFYATDLEQMIYPLGLNLLVLVVVTLLASYLAERLRLTGGQLQEANERAARAERLAELGKVAAGLAHEIRNPLGSISASIELLRDAPELNDDDRRLCSIIRSESVRLNDLVGDMLDLTRPRKLERLPTDVAVIAREVVDLAAGLGRSARDVRVIYDGPDRMVIDADSAQLRQLIWNLVRNGVQSTAAGTQVCVRVRDGAQPLIEVTDQGPGISTEALPHLFDAFFTTRSHGAGIGLAVVKRVVDEHGWSIDVATEGERTVFRVAISAIPNEQRNQTNPSTPDARATICGQN